MVRISLREESYAQIVNFLDEHGENDLADELISQKIKHNIVAKARRNNTNVENGYRKRRTKTLKKLIKGLEKLEGQGQAATIGQIARSSGLSQSTVKKYWVICSQMDEDESKTMETE